METLVMHPKNKEQLNALKAFVKALKIPFYMSTDEKLTKREKGIKLYGKDFVGEIESHEKAIKNGEFIVFDPNKKDMGKHSIDQLIFLLQQFNMPNQIIHFQP